jgi:alpha-glucan,water dikinase
MRDNLSASFIIKVILIYIETEINTIVSYPNKSVVLKGSGYIFRSDSNTEDLEGFAGAGLFDSIPMNKLQEVQMSYHNSEIFTNEQKVVTMMNKIAKLGIAVENIYNSPQDIEGCIVGNDIYIVQTRPQV